MRIKRAWTVVLVAGVILVASAKGDEKKTTKSLPKATATKKTSTPTSTAKKANELPEFEVAKFEAGMAKMLWSLGIQHDQEKYKPKTAKEFSEDLAGEAFLAGRPLLTPYGHHLPKLATFLGVLGDSLTYFFYGGEVTSFPFAIVDYKGSKCFVANVATADVYNTLKLGTTKQRAAKIAASHALPALRDMADELEGTDIKTVAVFVVYGTKNFLDDSVLATQAEAVGVIASVKDAKAFDDGETTDTEFIRKCTVLVSDRSETIDFSRVELQLD